MDDDGTPALVQSRRPSASPEAGVSDRDESSQSSAPLPPSSPLTDGDTNADGDAKSASIEKETKRSSKDPSPREQLNSDAGAVSAEAQIAGTLRATIRALGDLYHSRHPPYCEQYRYTVLPFEFRRLEPLLSAGQSHENDRLLVDLILDLSLTSNFICWAKDLKWEYDPQRALLIVHMSTRLHQCVQDRIRDEVISRLNIALGMSGHGGTIIPTNDLPCGLMDHEEPAPGPATGSTRPLPHRAARAGQNAVDPDSSRATSPEDDSTLMVKTYCPDLVLRYKPPGETKKDYYPGCVFEVGFSHPLEEWKAYNYIDCSSGYVRFIMAFNIEYSVDRLQPHPGITMSTWQLTVEGDTWFPQKCLDAYDVRAAAIGEEADTDIGLRLSHLHESLEEHDVPIKLSLRKLVNIVEEAYEDQVTHDNIVRTRRFPSPPKSLKGKKRARTDVTPATANDEAGLLRDPDASYRPSSAKRVKTKANE